MSRVVDDLTGAPIAGANVYFIKEVDTPIAGEFWYTRKVTTDEGGWLRAPVADIQDQWHMQVLRHKDYGVAARHGTGDFIWRIGRPFDVPVRILDWQGKPAAGAKVGFCMGCGHTPDLANAVTDSDGIAILRGIDPHGDIGDVYVQRVGLGLGYDSIRWNPGEYPEAIACRWSPAMTGTVVDHNGKPVSGVFVAALSVHRGPWAKTRVDGTFTLLGGRAETGASHVRTPEGREVWFDEPRRYPVTLRLPDPFAKAPNHGVIVQPPGNQIVPDTRKVRIQLHGHESLMARADWPGRPKSTDSDDEELSVPSSGPFVIHVYMTDGPSGRPSRRSFAFADASELPKEPVALAYYDATRVVGEIVDVSGDPVPARVCLRESWRVSDLHDSPGLKAATNFSLSTWQTGLSLVEIVPEAAELQPRLAWVMLPARGDKRRLDLGRLVVSRQAPLRVVGERDEALPGAEVTFARAGLQEVAHARRFPLSADGAWLGPDLRAGDAIVVRRTKDAVPFRKVLQGNGPWTLRAPAGSLQLDVTCAAGPKDITVTCTFGDYEYRWRSGKPLVGLPSGPLRCYVSAPGHKTAVVDVTIGALPTRLAVMLPKR